MRVTLLDGGPFKGGSESLENGYFIGRKDVPGALISSSVASMDQLHDDASGPGGDGAKFKKPVGVANLTVLDAQALALHGSE